MAVQNVANANSSMVQAATQQLGVVGDALLDANKIIEAGKYNADLQALQTRAQAPTGFQAAMGGLGGVVEGLGGYFGKKLELQQQGSQGSEGTGS